LQHFIKNIQVNKDTIHFFHNYKINIDKDRVFKSLDCFTDSPVYDIMDEIYYELIADIDDLLDVTASFYIEDTKSTSEIWEIQDCSQTIYTTATIGSRISEKIAELFAKYDQIEGVILDAIATEIVMEIGNQLHFLIYNYITENGFGAVMLSPGEYGASSAYQNTIKNKMGSQNNVDVTESFLLEPIKSSSRIYGLKPGIPAARELHNCKSCNDNLCKWRRTAYVSTS